jgi:hypothetical protein
MGTQDEPDAVLDVEEEVVDERLDVLLPCRLRECPKTSGEQPDVQVGDSEPGLEGGRERAACKKDMSALCCKVNSHARICYMSRVFV